MTNEQKRIKIAVACGWKPTRIKLPGGLCPIESMPPDYFHDLNAMHEAEKLLGDGRNTWDRYCDFLGGSLYNCAHATAEQRAEAFGKTLKLWQ